MAARVEPFTMPLVEPIEALSRAAVRSWEQFDATEAMAQIADGARPGLTDDGRYWFSRCVEVFGHLCRQGEGPADAEGVRGMLERLESVAEPVGIESPSGPPIQSCAIAGSCPATAPCATCSRTGATPTASARASTPGRGARRGD
jgi:hypothetical protein